MKINLQTINEALGAVSVALPQLTAAYAAYRVIWMALSPGKTEDDFLAHLDDVSKQTISAADAILVADGYVRGADGSWHKAAGG